MPSGPLVPQNDPTLLFTSAGMVPFKDFFTGIRPRPYPLATSCQKCLRAGGKHNDLEQVGRTQRHHTFFEMLGNFSFGDYFKEAAIAYAWEFLTHVLQLDKSRLWVTVYHTDDEAAMLWKKIAGLDDHKIISIATADNFWSAGDVGPCGPCSEIFYDHGPHLFGGLPGTADGDGDRYVELWNLVFMQFDQTGPNERISLPSPSIDTGMGLERISAVMQGVSDNFETDIFRAIIDRSKTYCTPSHHPHHRVAHRVIADHLRSSSFLLAEGVLPSNEGRGYVVRRILRRALRHIHYLGANPGHLALLLPVLIEKMGPSYPELSRAQELISAVLIQEGEQFEELLHKGLRRMEGWLNHAKPGGVFPGKDAFTLYDTFGFPLDLTQDILREKGCVVNEVEFQEHMEAQREKSRGSWVGSGLSAKAPAWDTLNSAYSKTDFLGYTQLQNQGNVLALLNQDRQVEGLSEGEKGYVLTEKTPFYPESGGQKGDVGNIVGPNGTADVLDTVKKGHLIAHHIHVTQGHLTVHDNVGWVVNGDNRKKTAAHHSATHLLQAALRSILGKHVMQKGSLVGPDKLRFDFSHSGPISWDLLQSVEVQINQWILENTPIQADTMAQDAALSTGAMAFFGEQYDDIVRVISMGDASKELCGGTHAQRTGDLGFFKIISESGVASGIRRIEAVVGIPALMVVQQWHHQLRHSAQRLKTSIPLLSEKIDQLMNAHQPLKAGTAWTIHCQKQHIGSHHFWHTSVTGASVKDLKGAVDQVKIELKSGLIVLTTIEGDKTSVVLGLTPDLASYDASALLNRALDPFGLSGGGRKDLAQGGGKGLPPHDTLMAHFLDTLTPLLCEG